MSKLKAFFLLHMIGLFGSCCDDQLKYITQITRIDFEPISAVIESNQLLEFRLIPRDSILYTAQGLNQGFFQSAYAYDCDDSDIYEPKESVESIQVVTLTDFSGNFQAGSNMNNLINVRFFNWRTEKIENYSLDDFVAFIQKDDSSTSRFAEIHNATYQITVRPENGQGHIFRFLFELSDNSNLITESGELMWK